MRRSDQFNCFPSSAILLPNRHPFSNCSFTLHSYFLLCTLNASKFLAQTLFLKKQLIIFHSKFTVATIAILTFVRYSHFSIPAITFIQYSVRFYSSAVFWQIVVFYLCPSRHLTYTVSITNSSSSTSTYAYRQCLDMQKAYHRFPHTSLSQFKSVYRVHS